MSRPAFPIDLHAHTTASDGTHTPTQLVERAARLGIRTLGVADHDTIAGLTEAIAAGQRLDLEIVPGVEFSLRHEADKHFVGIHLLGYFINLTAPALVEVMEKVRQGRIEQKKRQIEKLQTFGFEISVEEVFARVDGVPGRPHIAATLLERYPDRFTTPQQIFDEYLATHAKAHVVRQFALTLRQAVKVIKQAGGVPVFAHPGATSVQIDPVVAVRNARAEGIEGVEVYYPYETGHRPGENGRGWIERIDALASELNLLKTGGTDFHGRPHETIELGEMGLTAEQYAAFKRGWQQLRGTS
jgi:predicted metal-dependent phosphoesterase TrpH